MQQTAATISCCLCGRPVSADHAVDGRCLSCLAATVDISEGIDKELEIEMCKTCEQQGVHRWFRNPQWVVLEPESAELLSLCVRKIRGLKHVRLVDASWIWQEEHNRRLKVKLTVAKDVLSGQAIQQSFVINYGVKTRNCNACNKAAAKQDEWMAKVQVRQRAEHPRTLLAMEQQMLKRQSELGKAPPIGVKRTKEGLDFHFLRRQHAQRFVSLLHALAPCKSKSSSSVVATNAKQGTSNVKHTWSVEVAPICKGDLVLLPKSGNFQLPVGGQRWALVGAVGGTIRLIDPTSAQQFEVSSESYWRNPFTLLASKSSLSTFIVLDVEVGEESQTTPAKEAKENNNKAAHPGAHGGNAHWVHADATIARERDFGTNDVTHFVRTHLGGLIDAGDEAVGYDVEGMTGLDEEEEADAPQGVILLEKKRRSKRERGGGGASSKRSSSSGQRGQRGGGRKGGKKKSSGDGPDDGDSVCTSTSYQTEASDMLDAMSLAGDGGDGDEEELAIGDGFGEFLGTLDKGGERASGERSSNAEEEESVETTAVAIE